MNRPFLLLLGTGAALGLNFPLGKLAMAAGVNPALWAAVISLGAGLALLAVSAAIGRGQPSGATAFKFAIVSGFLSYVVPNFLTFAAIPKIGSGLAAIMFALSPVTTAILSLILKVRPPSMMGLLGIGFGLAGAIVIITARNSDFSGGGSTWLLLAALIPVFLGIGNVYRSLGWPQGVGTIRLAAVTNLAAVLPLLAVTFAMSGTLDLAPLAAIPGLTALQLAVSTTMFLMFFRLQQLGGPTYLSQIGYVAATVGVVIGVFFLDEIYPLTVWLGTAVVGAGVALTTIAQWRTARI